MRIRLATLMFSILALVGAWAGWIWYELSFPYYDRTAETFVDIPRGAGTSEIASALVARGVLRNKLPFTLYVRWYGLARHLRAGEYRFFAPARPAQIVQRLVQGDVFFRTLTVPEGLTARETIALMARNGFGKESDLLPLIGRVDWVADLDRRATSLEGYLFPETYRFSRHAAGEEMLKAMVAQFRHRTLSLLASDRLPAGWTLPEIVTLASMIEKEAKVQDERRLVASVLVNRLRIRMPLACDATIIYALKQAGTYDGNLHKSDMRMASPYNTYLHPGLPPGPIANPGIDSLQAALAPAASDFFYYVSRNDGTHFFSKDLQSHLLAVARFQKHK